MARETEKGGRQDVLAHRGMRRELAESPGEGGAFGDGRPINRMHVHGVGH